jgi:hypothetical protein
MLQCSRCKNTKTKTSSFLRKDRRLEIIAEGTAKSARLLPIQNGKKRIENIEMSICASGVSVPTD